MTQTPNTHPSNRITADTLDAFFTFQNDPGRYWRYPPVRNAAKQLAQVILDHAPDCADRSTALRMVREAVMYANAAIALAPELESQPFKSEDKP